MVSVRRHPGDSRDPVGSHGVSGPGTPGPGIPGPGIPGPNTTPGVPSHGGAGGRLNLLLSYAGWEPEPWVDRLPRLLEPMGIASVRANCGREATDVLRRSIVHVAVVDLGLPMERGTRPRSHPTGHADAQAKGPGAAADGATGPSSDNEPVADGGSRLLELLARLEAPPPVVVIKRARTVRDEVREMSAALRLGAFAVVDRPRGDHDLDVVLDVLRRILARYYRGQWPGATGP